MDTRSMRKKEGEGTERQIDVTEERHGVARHRKKQE